MDRMQAIWAGVVAGFAFGGVAIAEEQRFLVQGSRLFFNSSIPYAGGQEDEIVLRDAEEMGLYLMEVIDKQFLDTPFHSGQLINWHARNEGHAVDRPHIWCLKQLMRTVPIYGRL